jgi:uncharacterized membrane protein
MRPQQRIESIDALRGLAMLLMALDHTKDYFTNITYNPTDLQLTTAAMFFTRWITNFCAPVFVFLVGTSMFIAVSRGKSKKDTAIFLLTRGVWMIVAEFTLIHFAWSFDFNLSVQDCQVLWAIGWAMIVLAGLIFLPEWLILIMGLIILVGHNLLDGKELQLLGSWDWLHAIKHVTFDWFTPITLYLDYPLIPWIGIPALGYVFGNLFLLSKQKRTVYLFILGMACIIGFICLRYTNLYGDPYPWSVQKNLLYTCMSFINCYKYPPSLLFFLMTFGPAFLGMIVLEYTHNTFTRILAIFGKVPFFYYFMHIVLIHGLAAAVAYIRFGQADIFFGNQLLLFDTTKMAPYGYSLPMVYLAWLVVVALLFPACSWYANLKKQYKNNVLLSYL